MSRRSLALGLAGLAAFVAVGPVGVAAEPAHAALPQGSFTATVTASDTAPFATATSSATTGATTFRRTSRGHYTFFVANLGGAGNAQLSMIDTGDRFPICTVASQSHNSKGSTLNVRCATSTGTPIDGSFTVFFTTIRTTDPSIGYLALATSTAGNTTPSNQFRTRGTGKAKVNRVGTGSYQVTIPGETFTENDGVVMVSATGTNPRYCNPVGWAPTGSDTVISVECRRGNGSLSNANFSLVMTTRTLVGTSGGIGASGWSSSGGRDIESPLGPFNTYNSASETNTDINGASGETHLTLPGLLATPGEVTQMVVAHGPHRCGFAGASGASGDDVLLTVHCQTVAGSPIWTSFDAFAVVQPALP